MQLIDLKKEILNKRISSKFVLFLCSPEADLYEEGSGNKIILESKQTANDNKRFIVNEYLNNISKIKNMQISNVQSFKEQNKSAAALVFDFGEQLRVINTDVYSEFFEDTRELNNCIVICNKIESGLEKRLENSIIKVPRILSWQIEDYIQFNCDQINKEEAKWLCKACGNNIFKIQNELDKIIVFPKMQQLNVYNQLKNDLLKQYSDLSIFTVTNAIMSRNLLLLNTYLKQADLVDVEPLGLVTILLNNYKNILYLNFKSGVSLQDLGLNQWRAENIKRQGYGLSEAKIRNIIKFLSGIDYQLRDGKLDFGTNKKLFINYLINKLLLILE